MIFKPTLKPYLLAFAGCCALSGYAQTTPGSIKKFGKSIPTQFNYCGTTEYEKLLQQKNPKRATTVKFEQWIAPKIAQQKAAKLTAFGTNENTVVTIPVVFHIIHDGDAIGTDENIADGQVLSQIDVLNQDYRKAADTPGYNANPAGADMEIEFCMAHQDPNGMPSTGIVRYNMGNDRAWSMENLELLKTQTQWDPERYLNIWVFSDISGLAGYAQFPVESGLEGLETQEDIANTDGVALGCTYVGSEAIFPEGNYNETKNGGRTASHEIGHYLGLRHIWGDGTDCTATDYCDDTPAALQANYGCQIGLDSCPESEGPDMIENYMDYTDDACLNTFTQDQKLRMQAVLANSPRRASLLTANTCATGTAAIQKDGAVHIIPLNSTCGTSFTPAFYLRNTGTATITSAVINYHADNDAMATYNFTGSIAAGEGERIELPEISAATGDHTFTITLASINGSADDIASNNGGTLPFTVALPVADYNTTKVKVTLQADAHASEIVWALMDSNQNIVGFGGLYDDVEEGQPGPLDVQEFDVDSNACYIFFITEAGGDGICCSHGDGYYRVETTGGDIIAEGAQFAYIDYTRFSVNLTMGTKDIEKTLNNVTLFPNPANNTLTIALPQEAATPDAYTVYNSLGQVVGNGKFTSNLQTVDVSAYANGVYFVKINSANNAKTLQFIKN